MADFGLETFTMTFKKSIAVHKSQRLAATTPDYHLNFHSNHHNFYKQGVIEI